jgi:hypothetical protein
MVEIAIARTRKLQVSEADVVKSLVVNAESFICIFKKLVN